MGWTQSRNLMFLYWYLKNVLKFKIHKFSGIGDKFFLNVRPPQCVFSFLGTSCQNWGLPNWHGKVYSGCFRYIAVFIFRYRSILLTIVVKKWTYFFKIWNPKVCIKNCEWVEHHFPNKNLGSYNPRHLHIRSARICFILKIWRAWDHRWRFALANTS